MLRYKAGERVKPGFYWSPKTWEVETVQATGVALPDGGREYLRISPLVFLMMAPLLGLAYVVFLPFVGFALVADYVGRRLWQAGRAGFLEIMVTIRPHWQPGVAYLAAKKRRTKRPTGPALEALGDELEALSKDTPPRSEL
ncbi:MAG: hypothetical protein HYX76_12450 [Acidobacteria bacterium]|nr:hypothetical protein [Acidobacteriota bacterium]